MRLNLHDQHLHIQGGVPCCNPHTQKKHIGNDYVAIVYNDSIDQYTMGPVDGQFIYASARLLNVLQRGNCTVLQV